MKCDCGYATENKRLFGQHKRWPCPTYTTCPCGKVVRISNSRKGIRKYCSNTCRSKYAVTSLPGRKYTFNPKSKHTGENHYLWVGDKVSYGALHSWVKRNLGKAVKCEICGINEMPIGRKRFFEWANISREYKRELNDWKQVCMNCHKKFDNLPRFSKEESIEIRRRYANGESQRKIAKEYNVSRHMIWELINNRIAAYAL